MNYNSDNNYLFFDNSRNYSRDIVLKRQYPSIIKRGVLCFLSDLKRDSTKDDIDLRFDENTISDINIEIKMI